MVILIFAIIIILIQVVIIRWIFRIDEQINNQKATIWLLIKLCEKQGVSEEQLRNIMKVFKIKYF